jgi:hypothetical protein
VPTIALFERTAEAHRPYAYGADDRFWDKMGDLYRIDGRICEENRGIRAVLEIVQFAMMATA